MRSRQGRWAGPHALRRDPNLQQAMADWRAIQETLLLEAVPGLTESIRQARADGVEAASAELDW